MKIRYIKYWAFAAVLGMGTVSCEDFLNRLEALDGKSEQISMEKFRMYLAMNNDQQAFTEIENLAKEYPYDMRYLTILGDVYLNNGKEEETYETYQKVLNNCAAAGNAKTNASTSSPKFLYFFIIQNQV